jgi:hypothetical protein
MTGHPVHGREARMLRLLFAVIAPIATAMIAGVYFHFNPVILIFLILGCGNARREKFEIIASDLKRLDRENEKLMSAE